MLAFILLYKIGDTMASAMTTPFTWISVSARPRSARWSSFSVSGPPLPGGWPAGWSCCGSGSTGPCGCSACLQALSTACFVVLARTGPSVAALSGVIAFENLSSGMGTAAYAAFMASITNKKFTATQYALLTSLMGVPRVVASAPTGFLAKHMGWEAFFIACALIAIPGMLLLLKFAPWRAAALPARRG